MSAGTPSERQLRAASAFRSATILFDLRELGLAGLVGDDKHGARVFVLQLGQEQAHRRGDAGMQRRDRILRADQLRQRDRRAAGPAPPKPISVKLRGSMPLATELALMASAMLLLMTLQNSERGVGDGQAERRGDVFLDRLRAPAKGRS